MTQTITVGETLKFILHVFRPEIYQGIKQTNDLKVGVLIHKYYNSGIAAGNPSLLRRFYNFAQQTFILVSWPIRVNRD